MIKENIKQDEILLVGIQVRTNNAEEYKKLDGKIFPLVRRYFHEALAEKIPHRKNPATTFCAYTDYESDHTGDYTYFIGEEVTEVSEELLGEFEVLTIPSQSYAKFTTGPASMPAILENAWKEIWEMSPEKMGGERRYHTDYEIYDERAQDHENIVMDLYIGIS